MCGVKFEAERKNRIYCSNGCGKRAQFLREKTEPLSKITKKCKVCGKKFNAKNIRRIYCSNKCNVASHRGMHPGISAEYNKKRYIENSEKCKVIGKKYRVKLKKLVIKKYGGKCSCCGITDYEFLSIDHINGGGLKHLKEIKRKGGNSFYQWLKKKGFPPEFRLLCFNCNFAVGHYGYCPHNMMTAARDPLLHESSEAVTMTRP